MKLFSAYMWPKLAAVCLPVIALIGCGGGGSDSNAAAIHRITIQGSSGSLWTKTDGPSPPSSCPAGVAINAAITFDFGGSVDPASLPQGGSASGSINITTTPTSASQGSATNAAIGTFTVVDDPLLPSGNRRRVIFHPQLPADPANACGAGLNAATTYQITIPGSGSPGPTLIVNGHAIDNSVATCFTTCECPGASGGCQSLIDPVPGAAYVVSTTPATGNPSPGAVDPCSLAGNRVSVVFSEPLNPAGVSLQSIRLLDAATGAQVPGSLQFFQASTPSSPSRVDYVAASPLSGGRIYRLVISNSVTDLGGNAVELAPGNAGAQLYFATRAATPVAHAPILESFDTTTSLAGASGDLHWDGTGALVTTYPTLLTGDGSDGPLAPSANQTLDTGSPASRQGFFNYTDVNVPAGVTLRIVGPYRCHIRCTGSVVLAGSIDASAGANPGQSVPIGTPDQGPRFGAPNNGAGITCSAKGGFANAGGGRGGDGSPGACNARATAGEPGYGPPIDGVVDSGLPNTTLYAGGAGGASGCFPVIAAAPCVAGDLGGLGGAGGTAATSGEDGRPRQNNATCGINTGLTIVQPLATASPVPAVFIPPLAMNSAQSAGSGGGGGGDHLEAFGVAPSTDDQGGGGGGGGGSVRISCVGPFQMFAGQFSGRIACHGAAGAIGSTLSGAGGSGSGGQVWIESFSTVTIPATAFFDVMGPARTAGIMNLAGCSAQASGGGGSGLIQIEPAIGSVPTGFGTIPSTGAVISTAPFQYSGGVTGTVTSGFFYAEGGTPTYTGVVETRSLGNATGADLQIHYEGAFEAVNSTPQNRIFDSATIKTTSASGGPITAVNIQELNGYPFIRFRVAVTYPAPPSTPFNASLPSVQEIAINYSTTPGCP